MCDATHLASSYVIVSESLTWQDARSRCEGMAGHLVTIGSQEENDLINNIKASKFYKVLQSINKCFSKRDAEYNSP